MGANRALALFGVIAVLIVGVRGSAKADLAVYSDSLVNGWENWSWSATDLASTAYVHGGTKSAQVTYTGAWQGFFLHHSAFDTTLYTHLSFWIHGGGVNGRNIIVQALVNDVSQATVSLNTYITGGSVSGSAWRQVVIPLSALGADNKTNMTGFWLQDSGGGAQPAFYVDDINLVSVPPPSLVHLNVNANKAIRNIDSRVFGVNTEVWDGALNTPATATLLKAAAFRVLRFPGGSLSDGYHWKTNTSDSNTWTWASGFDAFAAIAKSTACQAFITVNYGTGTAQEAADWVTYANKTKALGIKYWEIGNENYGTWESDSQAVPHDPYTYAVRAKDYITKMKAVDPTIKIGVVVTTGEDSYANNTNHPTVNPRTGVTHNGWTPVLFATLNTLGVKPDFVIYHRYEQGPGNENDASLLEWTKTWKNDAADLRQQLTDYLGGQGAGVEMVCTENNSVYSNPGKQTTSLVNGLFWLDSFANLIQTEFNAMVWWDIRNAQEGYNNNSSSLYGWRQYGDYGIMSDLNDTYPTYYAMKLLSKFAKDGDTVIETTSDYSLLSTYAAKRTDGTMAILVINKSPNLTLNGGIAITGFTPKSVATLSLYGIAQDEAARTGVGSRDLRNTSFTGASNSFTRPFAPYSATVIVLAPNIAPISVVPIEDASVMAGSNANKNYGTATTFGARRSSDNSTNANNRVSYLKLDLTGLTTAPKSAILNLTLSGSTPITSSTPIKIYSVADTSWSETGITWNNAPGLNRVNFSSTGVFVASHLVPLGAAVTSFDLTSFVSTHLGQVVTLQIISETLDNNTVGFKSREAASGKPTLVVGY